MLNLINELYRTVEELKAKDPFYLEYGFYPEEGIALISTEVRSPKEEEQIERILEYCRSVKLEIRRTPVVKPGSVLLLKKSDYLNEIKRVHRGILKAYPSNLK